MGDDLNRFSERCPNRGREVRSARGCHVALLHIDYAWVYPLAEATGPPTAKLSETKALRLLTRAYVTSDNVNWLPSFLARMEQSCS